jgi:hypothetical protein
MDRHDGSAEALDRGIAGCIYELMILIDHDDSRAALASQELRDLLAVMPPARQESWSDLVAAAKKLAPAHSPLGRIRNNTGFHYDQKQLARGYVDHFDRDAAKDPRPTNQTAQYSLGMTIQGTRFHYADAAAQRALLNVGVELHPDTNPEQGIVEVAVKVNRAVGPLLQTFVAYRARRASGPASGRVGH